jgi:hypothetical protein
MQSQLSNHPGRISGRRALSREICPGVGIDGLFVGQSEGDVRALWGNPENEERRKESLYFVYSQLGIEVEIQRHRVQRIFFFNKGKAREVHLGPLTFGVSKMRVLEKKGPPTQEGEGRAVLDKYVRGWLYYAEGVQFEFGKGNKLELITIFSPDSQ